MSFQSILYGASAEAGAPSEPDYFRDLNLDQVVAAIIAGRGQYDLGPFFHDPLHSVEAVGFRQAVMRDLQRAPVMQATQAFAQALGDTRERLALAEKYHYKEQKQRWFMHAVESYCRGIRNLDDGLARLEFASDGMNQFRAYLKSYSSSPAFEELADSLSGLTKALGEVRYDILIKDNGFSVRNYDNEADYSLEVTQTFDKFRQGAVRDYQVDYKDTRDMDHVEAKILEFVALLNPDLFRAIDAFCQRESDFQDAIIARFDREIQFYVSYLEYIVRFEHAGLTFCYPELSATSKSVRSKASFDLALANKLLGENARVVCNDFSLDGKERIFLVSGPNQGGKTTFSRVFGQLHHLASLGCPVPGTVAHLFLPDRIFAHYEREENIANLRGKLQDDLVRIHEILQKATPQSIIIMNEIFNSTTLRDAVFLARRVIQEIVRKDIIAVCVTFLDELTDLSDTIVSMVSTIAPDDPATRTFQVIRRPADGRSYAISIAEKYRVTYDHLMSRIPQTNETRVKVAQSGTSLPLDGSPA